MVGAGRPNDLGGRLSVDPSSEMVLVATGGDVRELQRTLYACAKRSPERRFHALYDRIHRSDVVLGAWKRVRKNRGAAGVDRMTLAEVEAYGVERMLGELQDALRRGSYRPVPVRRVAIPKPDGGSRPLGIPTVCDRVVQQATRMVLEPIFEADFLEVSYGFRPKRSALDALERIRVAFPRGAVWIAEADIRDYLEASSHCFRVDDGWVEESVVVGNDLDSDAFSASLADVDGVQFAALDTLQHRLAGDAEDLRRFEHRQPAGRRVLHEALAQLVVDADLPGCAGGELFAGDEAVGEPAVDRRRRDVKDLGGAGDRDQFAVGRRGGLLVARDLAVGAQAGDDLRGEALAGGRAAALAVEDPGDRGVVVVGGEAPEQRDRVLVGADRGLAAGELNDELADRAATPAHGHGRLELLAGDVEGHVFDQCAQQLLAVAVGRRGCRPDAAEVGT